MNLDSGAIDNVIDRRTGGQFPIRETEMSKAGAYYEAANGSPIPNLGERDVLGWTNDGIATAQTFQVADVKGPLGSVRKICQAGNYVLFDEVGGVIVNKETGAKTGFTLNEKGVYSLQIWVKKQGFPRQA